MATEIIHVDDDPISLGHIKPIISNIEGIVYAGSYNNAQDALVHLKQAQVPTILILDVEMPKQNGLWLAKQVSNLDVSIIFVTAFAGYAVEAFEACALQYLLKPVSAGKLITAISYVQSLQVGSKNTRYQIKEFAENYIAEDTYPKQVFIRNVNNIHIINLTDLMHITSAGHYSHFVTVNGKKYISSKNLKIYDETICKNPKFLRIHRSAIINIDYVQSINRKAHMTSVIMKDKTSLEVSPIKRDTILFQISNRS